MIKEGKYLIDLIEAVVNNQKLEKITEEVNYKKITKLAKFHSVEALLYKGIVDNNINIPKDQLDYLSKVNLINIYKDTTQAEEKKLIGEHLEANKINHIFLKGSVMKTLYPETYLRSMADIDILVDTSKLKQISTIMKQIGYSVEHTGGNHDVFYKQPFMNIEMHREMIDESYIYSKYYKDIWNRIKICNGKEYEYYLTDEDYYIYMMTHTAKHFSNGGTGIRSIIDEWIFLKHKEKTLNWDYINKEFEKLNLLKFASNIKELANIWFNNKESNETFDLISEYIISSGTYGITSNSMIIRGFMYDETKSLGKRKFRFILSKMFPPLKEIRRIYPVLKKLPFLIPLFWIIRLIKIVLFRRKNIKNVYNDLNEVEDSKIDKVKEIHEKSGL